MCVGVVAEDADREYSIRISERRDGLQPVGLQAAVAGRQCSTYTVTTMISEGVRDMHERGG